MMKLNQFLDVLGRSNSGFVSIFVVVVGVILLASWASYAYFNPHTPSGQLLIRVNSDFFFKKKILKMTLRKDAFVVVAILCYRKINLVVRKY